MERYLIRRISGTPDWADIPILKVGNYQWQEEMDIRMEVQICRDNENLYLRMAACEKNIRAEHREPLGMVCEDSCMEFFFRPAENGLRYFNFEINPNGMMFIGFGSSKDNLVRLAPSPALFEPRTAYTNDGWTAQYRIPAEFIRVFFPEFILEKGRKIYANCYKCGHKTLVPHYITWNKVNSAIPSFHRPEDFGLMEMG